MTTSIHEELAKNEMYRDTFMKPKTACIPKEVRGWPDYLEELFCVLSVWHLEEGFDQDEADRTAVEQVKESARYQEWQEELRLP